MLFFVECDALVPIPPFHLIIIKRGLQLSSCICGLHDHMVSAKKTLVDVKERNLTILCTLPLFLIDVCIHVHEHLLENMRNKSIVYIECIKLVFKVDSDQGFLIKLEV